MPSQVEIKQVFESVEGALVANPDLGLVTAVSVARVEDGLGCVVTENDWTLKVDMPTRLGGPEIEPNPGVYGRAALSSCMAISYMLWASKLEVEINSLEVEIQADSNEGSIVGTAAVPAGYLDVRCIVRIESDAAEEDIVSMLDQADEHSPYRDVFVRPQSLTRTQQIVATSV